jgi:hypothetical protein
MRKMMLLFSATIAAGCSSTTSYNEQIFPAYEAYRDGDVSAASDISSAIYEEYYDDNSRVIFALENGTMLRDAGYYQQAFDVLEQAEATLKIGYDERSALNVGAMTESVASVLVNQKSLAYTGTIYDRVLLNTYKALAMLELNKIDNALVEARRIDQAQQRAEELFREEYEAIKAEAKDKGYDVNLDKMYSNEEFVKQNRGLFKDAGVDDFQNPFATFVIGMLRRIAPSNGEDPTYDFRWLKNRLPSNVYVKQELEAIVNGEDVDGSVYVIFENGRGPSLAENRIIIPTGSFGYYSGGDGLRIFNEEYLALPRFVPGRKAANALEVIAGPANRSTTMMVADMNSIALHEFNVRYPGILMREMVSAAIKGIAFGVGQIVAADMMSSDDDDTAILGLLLGIGSAVAKGAIAQADDRAWKSIACNYQIARFKRGEGNTLRLNLIGGNAATTVEMPDAAAVVVIVRSVNSSHINARAYGFGESTMIK